jgi:hypothetical protein
MLRVVCIREVQLSGAGVRLIEAQKDMCDIWKTRPMMQLFEPPPIEPRVSAAFGRSDFGVQLVTTPEEKKCLESEKAEYK